MTDRALDRAAVTAATCDLSLTTPVLSRPGRGRTTRTHTQLELFGLRSTEPVTGRTTSRKANRS